MKEPSPLQTELDEIFMRLALQEAERAAEAGEIPIGAVVVKEGGIVGTGFNRRETRHDPTAHAEVLAIQRAAKALRRWRLTGCTLYATIAACPMCAGAAVLPRVDRVVYGAADPKGGAVGSLSAIARDPRLNHRIDVVSGVLETDCANIMRSFFRTLREKP